MLHSSILSHIGQNKPLLLNFCLPGKVALLVGLPEPVLDHLGGLDALVAGPYHIRHGHKIVLTVVHTNDQRGTLLI